MNKRTLDRIHTWVEKKKATKEEEGIKDRVIELWEKNEMNRRAVTEQTIELLAIWGTIALMREARENASKS